MKSNLSSISIDLSYGILKKKVCLLISFFEFIKFFLFHIYIEAFKSKIDGASCLLLIFFLGSQTIFRFFFFYT